VPAVSFASLHHINDLPPYMASRYESEPNTLRPRKSGQKIQAVCGKLGAPCGSEGFATVVGGETTVCLS